MPGTPGGEPSRAVDARLVRILYLLFVVSGAAGLVYEVLWASLLGGLVGGTTATHTVVLAAFMGGLALGNHFGGRWADGTIAPLRLYAYLEAVVGVFGILSPQLADLAGTTYVALAPVPGGSLEFLDGPLRLALAVLTILPASFAMGATLPTLVRACTTSLAGLGTSVGWLYFINSVGATAGALSASFLVMPSFGLDFGLILTGSTNLLLALIALALARSTPDSPQEAPKPDEEPAAPTPVSEARTYAPAQVKAAVAAVVLSGMAAMVIEIVWTRVLALTMGGSAHAFAIMLGTFIAGIAVGGVVAARVARGDRDAYRPLLVAEAAAAVSLVVLLPWYDHLPFLFHGAASVLAPKADAYSAYLVTCTAIAMLAMLLPTIALGATLPLASRVVTASLGQAGQKVGDVFSVNTIGNVAGATLGGLVLVDALGIEVTLRIGVFLLVLATVRLLWTLPAARLRTFGLAGSGVAALVLVVLPGWDPTLIHSGLYRSLEADLQSVEQLRQAQRIEFLFEDDDAEATVAVIENDRGLRLLRVNGKSDAGNRGDVPTQLMVGQLPFLFHPDAKRVLIVGLGSGITVGGVLTQPVDHVDVVEISPAIVEASRLFDAWSGAPLDDERVTLHVRDARNILRVLPEDARYDIIISQPSNPWQPGSAMMFTREAYELMASRLAPGGVLSQWFQTYEMDDDVLGVILRTYGGVFPKARVFNSRRNDMILIASRDGLKTDIPAMRRVLERPKVLASLARTTRDRRPPTLETLLMHEVMGPEEFRKRWSAHQEEGIHTDRLPVLQYIAPKAFFVGARAEAFAKADARRRPRASSELLLAPLLGKGPLSDERLATVDAYLAAADYPLDKGLAAAVALERWRRAPKDPARLTRLKQLELLGEVGESQRVELLAAAGPPADARTCLARVRRELEVLRTRTSIFTPVPTTALDTQRNDCLKRFPELRSQLTIVDDEARRYRSQR